MTENEAKRRWCPMINFQIGPINSSVWQGVAYNNRGQEYEPKTCQCIASDCMMWVWDDKGYPIGQRADGEPIFASDDENEGHCGLAK